MRLLLTVFLVAGIFCLLLLAAIWAGQERAVWQPPALAGTPPAGATRLDFAADDGQRLHAFVVGDAARAPGLLVAFHGNAELAAWNLPWAEEVHRRTGWAVLLPEYRGYDGLGGSPTYAGSRLDARAAWRLARERLGADTARIALYGHSLGTAVASELAAEHRPAALILLAPFTSARDMAASIRVPPIGLLWPLIGRIHFDTRARVATLDAPVSVAHGDRDAVIPVRMGRAVHDAARLRGELLVVPGRGHNDVTDTAEYWTWLERALGRKA